MKFSVDPWDPSYGSALEEVLEPTEVADLGEEVVELPGQAPPVLHHAVLRGTQLVDRVTGAD